MKMKIKLIMLWLFTMITTLQVVAVDDIYYSTSDAEADKVAYDKKRKEEVNKLRQQTLVIKAKEQQLVKAIGDTIYVEDTSIVDNNYYMDTIVIVDDDDFQYTRRLNAFHDTDYEIYDAANDGVNLYVVNDFGWNYPYYDYWSYRNWRYGYLWGYPYYSYNPYWYWGHNCHYYCHHHHHHHYPIARPYPEYKPSLGGSSTAHRIGVRTSGNRRVASASTGGVRTSVGTRSTVNRTGSREIVRSGSVSSSRSSSGVSGTPQRSVTRSSGYSSGGSTRSSVYSGSGRTRSSSSYSRGSSSSSYSSSSRSSSGYSSGSYSSGGSYSGSRSSGSYSSGSSSSSRSSGSYSSGGGYSGGGGRSSGSYSGGGGRSSGGRR